MPVPLLWTETVASVKLQEAALTRVETKRTKDSMLESILRSCSIVYRVSANVQFFRSYVKIL